MEYAFLRTADETAFDVLQRDVATCYFLSHPSLDEVLLEKDGIDTCKNG
jgi:hypothetical protein